MPTRGETKRDLDDVQVLGDWNYTIQPDTPLVWVRSGALDRYLLKFSVTSHLPSTAGFIFHAEADGPGIDGVSFWIERRTNPETGEHYRRYVLSGDGLESKPIATRRYPEASDKEDVEEVEILVQGFSACIFLRKRKVQMKLRTKPGRGSICFYNSTKATEEGLSDDVTFSNVRITALRRGPLEIDGTLRRREQILKAPAVPEQAEDGMLDASDGDDKVDSHGESMMTTVPPDSPENSLEFTRSGGMRRTASTPAMAKGSQTFKGKLGMSQTQGSFAALGAPSTLGRTHPSKMRDATLRKSGGAVLASTAKGSTFGGFGSKSWTPLGQNPAKSEQQIARDNILKPSMQKRANACHDFIPM
jgi:hypothetical protein